MGSHLSVILGLCIILAALPAACFADTHDVQYRIRASPSAGLVRINEVMFNPTDVEVDGEWIELLNIAEVSVDLGGWTISDQEDATDFTFFDITIPPAGLAVVHVGAGVNDTVFTDLCAEFYMGKTSTVLSNTGDDVLLADQAGDTVDFISYGEWDGASVQPPPADFSYEHSNETAPEGYTLAHDGEIIRQSVPTELRGNGADRPWGEGLVLSQVHYYAWGENEFVAVHNSLQITVDISFWCISDGEGTLAFPRGTEIQPGADLTAAQNATNFRIQTARNPDFEFDGSDAAVPDMTVMGSKPMFSNTGDEAFLMNNWGTHIDAYAYGASFYIGEDWTSAPSLLLGQGQVAMRSLGSADTNASADWNCIREYAVGQSDFSSADFLADGPVRVFVSPDSSFGAIAGLIDNSTVRFWLTVYEFTQGPLADRLAAASHRGVDIRVFLEGSPVGGLTPKELFLARKIVEAGGQVRMMTNDPDNGIHERYSFVHAKYALADDDTLLIMSENWGEYGVPLPGETGNRGWGAAITDPAIASYFTSVFEEDWNPQMSDSVSFNSSHPLWNSGVNSTSENPEFTAAFQPLTVNSPAHITPVLAPDTSLSENTILGMLGSATERVYVEEFYIYKHWGDRSSGSTVATPNLYLEAVIEAARRGCEVKILLDATYYNSMDTDPIDNDDTVAYVNAIALAEGLDLHAKSVNITQHDFEKIHNKGVIADDKVLISSINWNLNSVTANRESGAIIQNSEVSEYFAAVFADDWKDDRTPPFAHFRVNDSYRANASTGINTSTSSDNVGITNYTWSVNGVVVCYGLYFTHEISIPGNYTLNLTAADAWGNVGTYEAAIVIIAQDSGTDSQNSTAAGSVAIPMLLILIAIIIILAIVAIFIKKRR